ncbi:MAG TPA: MBG domain-containing protein, partial [Acidobacteriaceae bacterium]
VNASALASGNYTFTAVGGTLNVAKAAATVTANNLSTTAGSAIPTLTYAVTGLVAGDQAAAALTGAPQLSTTATSSSKVGSYPINIANGSMAAKNYTLALVNGTMTLTQASTSVANPTPITPRLPSKKLP